MGRKYRNKGDLVYFEYSNPLNWGRLNIGYNNWSIGDYLCEYSCTHVRSGGVFMVM